MRFKRSALLLAAAAAAIVLAFPARSPAATFEILGFGTYINPHANNRYGDPRLDVGSKTAFGGGINIGWTRQISTEVTVSETRPSTKARVGTAPSADFGQMRMVPITGTLQFHFLPGTRFDPYVGAGAARVLFRDLRSATLAGIGVDRIQLRDKNTFLANAGLTLGLTDRFGVFVDAKYLPLKTSAVALSGTTAIDRLDLRVNPFLFSTGLRLRF